MTAALPRMLADLEELVRCESPSRDLAAVAVSADVVARLGTERLGTEPERIVLDGRTHLRWRLGTGPARVLVLGHHDTVWPIGSVPARVALRRRRGPRARLLRHEGRPRARLHRPRRAAGPGRRHGAGHRRRGA